jgi:heptosyltransferase-3
MNSILVIRGGAIGDFILTMPALAALRRRFPRGRVELLANPSVAGLAVEFGLADNIRDLNSISFVPLFSANGKCPADTASWLAGFEVIVSYAFDPERVFHENLRHCSNAQIIVGPHRPNDGTKTHASRQLLAPLHDLTDIAFDIQSAFFEVHRSSSNLIALHPGSGSAQKNWPQESWESLLKQLVAATDYRFLLIGGEAERERWSKLVEMLPANRRELAFDLPLVELARLLKTCRAFVGHDSGITQLAAVLGLDCVALWGPTNESVWKPLGNRTRLLHDPRGLRFLPVNAVVNALNSLLHTP